MISDENDLTADANQRQKQLLKEHFEELGSEDGESDEEDDREGDASSMDEYSQDEGGRQQKQRREAGGRAESSGRGKGPRLYAARNDAAATAFKAEESLAGLQSLPLADRLAAAGNAGATGRRRVGGQRELTFTPRSSERGGRGRGRGERGRGRGMPGKASLGGFDFLGGGEKRPARGGRGGRGRGGGGRKRGRH